MSDRGTELFEELSRRVGAELVGDPYPAFAEKRRATPVMEGCIMAEFGLPSVAQTTGGPCFTLFRYDDVTDALKAGDTYSSAVQASLFEPIMGRVILGLDGREHRAFRELITPGFTKKVVDHWQATMVRGAAREVVAELAQAGNRANLVDVAIRYPVKVIYQVVGFPPDESIYASFVEAGLTMSLALQGLSTADPEEVMQVLRNAQQASLAVYDEILPIVQARRASGDYGSDLISHLLRAEFEGERLDDDTIATFVRSLLPAAAETTTRNWMNCMTLLFNHPDVLDDVRKDRALVLGMLNEGMRLESSTTVLGRNLSRDVELRGVHMPAGAGITLATGAANRDEEIYPDPDRYDIRRKHAKPGLTFGLGPHFCPGMQVAKVEMLELTNAVLDGLPNVRLDPGAEPPVIRGMMMRSALSLDVVWD